MRPPRRRSATLRDRGARVVDLSADFRLSIACHLRALVRRAPAPGSAPAGRLRIDRAAPRADRERRDRRQPGLLPDGLSARPRAARAGRVDRRRRDRRQAGPLGGGPCIRRDDARLVRGREHPALQGGRTPPHAGDRGAALRCAQPPARATRSRCCSRRTSSRSTRASWSIATYADAPSRGRASWPSSSSPLTPTSRSSRSSARRRARATCRRRTSAACCEGRPRTAAR